MLLLPHMQVWCYPVVLPISLLTLPLGPVPPQAQVMARSQAMPQAAYPLDSHPFALLGHAALQPAQMVQYLQQHQQLLMQQLLLQQHQAAAAAAEEEQQQECLVGPFGQYQGYCNQASPWHCMGECAGANCLVSGWGEGGRREREDGYPHWSAA